MKKISLIIFLLFLFTCKSFSQENNDKFGQFTDPRDEQTYKTVKIGNQVWIAENLNFKTENSWCYEDNPENCKTYGSLYTWDIAFEACPAGWHLPTDDEWKTLINYLGGEDVAGGKMKESGTSHWEPPNEDATNSSGFSALPGGYRGSDGSFNFLGYYARFWSATEYDSSYAFYRLLLYNNADVGWYHRDKLGSFSVRCVQN